jgi:hypothetical protein
VDGPGGVFDEEQHMDPLEEHGVDGEVGPRARFDVAIVRFPRTPSRTRRAPLSAPGAPRVLPCGQLLGAAAGFGVQGVAMVCPR